MAYNGYLLPYVSLIKHLASTGMTSPQISRHLYDAGVRATWGCWDKSDEGNIQSMAGMVNYIVRGGPIKKKKLEVKKADKVTVVTQDWQTWTPALQEAEFQMGYSR